MVSVPEGCPSTSTSGDPQPLIPNVEPTTPVSLKPIEFPESLKEASTTSESKCEEPTLSSTAGSAVEKGKRPTLPVRPVAPNELIDMKFPCSKCTTSTEYSLSEFILHQYSAHEVISCIYCDEEFQFAREVMVHLHREHRLNNQKFESDEEFLRRGGGRTTVICVECNRLLLMSSDNGQNILSNHECRKPPICQDCGLILENMTLEQHAPVCSHERKADSFGSSSVELEFCKFCKRKLQHKVEGQYACASCERIGVHNLTVKLPVPLLKTGIHMNQLPPIPQLTLSSTRKTTKAIPPLLPAFGNTALSHYNSIASDSFISRNKKPPSVNKSPASKVQEPPGHTSPNSVLGTEISRMNFSSSITVTPLNSGTNSVLEEEPTAGSADKPNHHSNKSQENTDLARPKRSLKRVTHEDFMYEKQMKRRVPAPIVSITSVSLGKSSRTPTLKRPAASKARKSMENTCRPVPNLEPAGNNFVANGISHEQPEDDLSEPDKTPLPEVKLDPLLLEPDSKKRVEILIKELAQILLLQQREAAWNTEAANKAPFSILLSEGSTDSEFLNQMIEKSADECHYCRQVKIIRIDKRQLILHLLRKHDWVVKSIRKPKEERVKTDVTIGSYEGEKTSVEMSAAKSLEPLVDHVKGEISLEKQENLRHETALSIENGLKLPQNDKCDPDEQGKGIPDARVDQDIEQIKSEKVEIQSEQPEGPLSPSSTFGQLQIIEDEARDMEMGSEEFYLYTLRKVFTSEKIVFTYASVKTELGNIPCECLICGFLSDSQVNLYPHWRKSHRGMSMKCPMCHTSFLFAGALFSHICLGIPYQRMNTSNSGGIVGNAGVMDPAQGEANTGVDGGTSHDTYTLRYQCGLCPDLSLPGFFNYMVHCRRDHLRCELCLESLPGQRELEHHWKKHKLNHFCWKCSIAYLSKPNFMTHLFWKHGTESRECSVCLKKKWPHIYHFCIPPAWFTCDVCGLFFTKSKTLRVHKRLHTGDKIRHCTECNQKFISASLLRKHMAAEHELKSIEAPPPVEESKVNGCESENSGAEDDANILKDKAVTETPSVKTKEQSKESKEIVSSESVGSLGIVSPVRGEKAGLESDPKPEMPNGENDNLPVQSELLQELDSVVKPVIDTPNPKTESSKTDEPVEFSAEKPPAESKDQPLQKMNSKKKRQKSDFPLDSAHGLNLSEDEGLDGLPSSSPSSLSEGEAEKASTVFEESRSEKDQKCSPVDAVSLVGPAASDPVMSNTETEVTKDLPKSPTVFAVPLIPMLPPAAQCVNGQKPKQNLPSAMPVVNNRQGLGDLPSATPRLDLSSTATAMLFDEKGILEQQPASPLLHPLDDLIPNTPEVYPTFTDNSLPDHISLEKALNSILSEHNYCMLPEISATSSTKHNKRKTPHGVSNVAEDGLHTQVATTFRKKLKVLKPVRKPVATATGRKRKRPRSSSSSSSSSSCSSCGSNCSCSSGSSSSSSSNSGESSNSSDSDSDAPGQDKKKVSAKKGRKLKQIPLKVKPFPQRRGRKPKLEEPPKVKKPKGRPPKILKRVKADVKPPSKADGLGNREAEILKHFENPLDAFILEEDLDTTDSDSDEIFHKKQLTEAVLPIPSFISEAWTAGNEAFLLKEVKGVSDLESLRPKPQAPKRIKRKPVGSQPTAKHSTHIVSHGKSGDHFNGNAPGITAGIAQVAGKGSLQSSMNSNSNTITISRGTVSSGPALSTSSLTKGTKPVLLTTAITKASPASKQGNISSSLPSSQSMNVSDRQMAPDKVRSGTPTFSDKGLSILEGDTGNPPTPKARRARMKVTEIKSKTAPTPPPLPPMEVTIDTDEKLYCICQGPHDNVSQMIGCDAKDCPYQWFHFECVGIVVAPKGKWFCPECKDKRRQRSLQIHKLESQGGEMDSGGGNKSSSSDRGGGKPKVYANNTFIGHTVS